MEQDAADCETKHNPEADAKLRAHGVKLLSSAATAGYLS